MALFGLFLPAFWALGCAALSCAHLSVDACQSWRWPVIILGAFLMNIGIVLVEPDTTTVLLLYLSLGGACLCELIGPPLAVVWAQ